MKASNSSEAAASGAAVARSSTVSFADIAHQTLIFDVEQPAEKLVVELVDTRWMQRLRDISQTGNTKLVYMFAEHSRFGHSLGVAYLANMLMKHLARITPEMIKPYRTAVAAAALLHDVGHVAPGSHLGEKVWAPARPGQHEAISTRIIREDSQITEVLSRSAAGLPELVCRILQDDPSLPGWTTAIISGGGWNADRGNWAIVDSAMCCVSYGRYNVAALIDAFRLSEGGELVLQENRCDALTHFFMARDSMYRQIYQHRVLQAADIISQHIIRRVRELIGAADSRQETEAALEKSRIFADHAMVSALTSENYAVDLALEDVFCMTESWWSYHVGRWCDCSDRILKDLASRLRDRRLLKTVRIEGSAGESSGASAGDELNALVEQATRIAVELGYDPRYYVNVVKEKDKHRGKLETAPMVLLDNGELVPATEIEPMIAQIMQRDTTPRTWLAVPKEIKDRLGRLR